MRVLVTGGAGFLGRRVARRMLEAGHDVGVFDLAPPAAGDVEALVGDLTDAGDVGRAVKGFDVVLHIGAIGDVYVAAENPALAAAVNVTGTAHVAAAAVEFGARVVYASTWEVYGHPVYEPMDEEHPCTPDHPYNITKLAGERLLLSACALRQLDAVALRLGTAYGPGLRPNSVFRVFIDRARRGEPITVQGDGAQSRQFTHADDIARAFEMAASAGINGEVVNIVGNEPISIRRLAETVAARLPTELTFGDPRPGDVAPAVVSSEKAAEVLGWRPQIPFDQGLAALIDEDG